MSRIAKHPISIPSGVDVKLNGSRVTAKGKLGELHLDIHDDISVTMADGAITLKPKSENTKTLAMWGTMASRVRGMMKGVSEGFTKKLLIEGVGYRAAMQGKDLVMQLGFSHEVRYKVPQGIEIKCPKPTELEISGYNKQQVGQVASEIITFRRPEPYKGKGIRYEGQRILRKEGKKK